MEEKSRLRFKVVLAWLAGLLVLSALMANSYLYMDLSENPLEVGAFAGTCSIASRAWVKVGFLSWAKDFHYYPPGYYAWLTAWMTPYERTGLPGLVMWSNVLAGLGLLGVVAAMIRSGANAAGVAAALFLLGGTPIFNIATKTLSFEIGVLFATGGVLWLLSGPTGLPSRPRSALLGAIVGAGLMMKWTVVLYIAGPFVVASFLWFRGGGTLREGALRLGLAVAMTLVVAGPWYGLCLDFELLKQTTQNDATVPAGLGFRGYVLQYCRYLESLRVGSGIALCGVFLLGLGFGLVRRPPGTALFLSSAVVAMAVLPVFMHQEPRYLIPLLPSLAAIAGLGFGGLNFSEAIFAAALTGLVATYQVADSTWHNYYWTPAYYRPGHQPAYDDNMRMVWPPKVASHLFLRCKMLAHALAQYGEQLHFGVHPLNPNPGLDAQALGFYSHSDERADDEALFLGYDWTGYCSFLKDMEEGRLTFLIMSARSFWVEGQTARQVVHTAWSYVDQGGQGVRCNGAKPLPEPFAFDLIRKQYTILETLAVDRDEIWLMVRRDVWARTHGQFPVSPLPMAEEFGLPAK